MVLGSIAGVALLYELVQTAHQPDGSYVFSFTGPLSHLNSRPGR